MSSFANCSQELGIQVRILAGLRGGTSAVVLLLTVGLLVIACCCGVGKGEKWLKTSLIVLFGSSISYLAVLFTSVFHVFLPSSWIGTWCKMFGFLDQTFSALLTSMLLVNVHPSVTLILNILYQECYGVRCCKKTWVITSFVAVVSVATTMVIISSIAPLFTGTYGPVGGWCWINDEDNNCKYSNQLTVGVLEQIFLWYTVCAIVFLMCITLMAAAVGMYAKKTFCKDFQVLRNIGNSRQKRAKAFGKAIAQLIVFVPIILHFITFGLRASSNNSPSVWVIFAVVPPSVGFLIPLSLVFYVHCRPDETKSVQHDVSYGALTERENTLTSSSDYYCTATDDSYEGNFYRALQETENIQSTDYSCASTASNGSSSSYDSVSDD